jgi:hypothetical protein
MSEHVNRMASPDKDWDTARSLLSPDVHVTATHNGPYPPPTDLTGADDYMKGLAAFDPSGPAVAAPCARLYLVENGKIKTEQVVFYVSQG